MRNWLSTGAVTAVQARRRRFGVGNRVGINVHGTLQERQVEQSAERVQCERELFEDVRRVKHHSKGLADGCRALEGIPEVQPAVGSGSVAEYQLEAGPAPVDEILRRMSESPLCTLRSSTAHG